MQNASCHELYNLHELHTNGDWLHGKQQVLGGIKRVVENYVVDYGWHCPRENSQQEHLVWTVLRQLTAVEYKIPRR